MIIIYLNRFSKIFKNFEISKIKFLNKCLYPDLDYLDICIHFFFVIHRNVKYPLIQKKKQQYISLIIIILRRVVFYFTSFLIKNI